MRWRRNYGLIQYVRGVLALYYYIRGCNTSSHTHTVSKGFQSNTRLKFSTTGTILSTDQGEMERAATNNVSEILVNCNSQITLSPRSELVGEWVKKWWTGGPLQLLYLSHEQLLFFGVGCFFGSKKLSSYYAKYCQQHKLTCGVYQSVKYLTLSIVVKGLSWRNSVMVLSESSTCE